MPDGSDDQARGTRWPAESTAEVRRAVAAHDPVGARETEARERILTALGELADPLDVDAGPTHVTGSAIVVGRRGTVLHMHKRLHRWLQPGGHLDPGESPAEAAWREAQEETGLPLHHPQGGPLLIHVDVHPAASGHTHLDLRYLLVAPDVDPSPPSGESPLARWYPWDEAMAVADDALRGALEAARERVETGTAGELFAAGRAPGGRGDG